MYIYNKYLNNFNKELIFKDFIKPDKNINVHIYAVSHIIIIICVFFINRWMYNSIKIINTKLWTYLYWNCQKHDSVVYRNMYLNTTERT